MQDATVLSDLHSPHIGGDLPPITSEPTGPPGNNEPTVHDVPTGPLIDTPPVAGAQSPLPLSGPRTQQRTFLPQRGVYYAVIAGVIAGVFNALLTIVVILVNAGSFHAASQQIAVDRLTVKTALALAAWELLNFTLSLLVGFVVGYIVGRIAVRRRLGFLAGALAGAVFYIITFLVSLISSYPGNLAVNGTILTTGSLVIAFLLLCLWSIGESIRNMGSDCETSSLYQDRRVTGMYMQTYLASNKRPSDLADDVLVQQAQVGDQGAFEILVERYSALLFLLISRLVRDEHLAHDVLQYVFLQLYRSLPTLRTGGTLKAWLCQVARHRCIDQLRRKRPIFFSEIASVPDEEECSPLTALPDPDRQPEEQVELHELRQRLLEAIEALPPHLRAVVRLRYANQLSFREIGRALRIPEATAKTYFYRARNPLRTLLGPEFANDGGMEKQ